MKGGLTYLPDMSENSAEGHYDTWQMDLEGTTLPLYWTYFYDEPVNGSVAGMCMWGSGGMTPVFFQR